MFRVSTKSDQLGLTDSFLIVQAIDLSFYQRGVVHISLFYLQSRTPHAHAHQVDSAVSFANTSVG